LIEANLHDKPSVNQTGVNQMKVLAQMKAGKHEQIVFVQDLDAGLRAIIAIHNTTLGPALGGTRMYPYATEEQALRDVLDLSRGMTYKAAAAGLDLGGGKAVIIGDPLTQKSDALLRAYGRFVNRLAGVFHTGEDVGTDVSDMEVVRTETRFVGGLSRERGGGGDPSPVTAYGVLQGMKACAAERWGHDSLEGRRVAVQGLGKVGWHLTELLQNAQATVVGSDVNRDRAAQARQLLGIETVDPDAIYDVSADIFAPCALGGAISVDTVPRLTCDVIAGSANNQIASSAAVRMVSERGILYAPDYVINAGGLMNVWVELQGYDSARALKLAGDIYSNLREVFSVARRLEMTTSAAADRIAEERLARGALMKTRLGRQGDGAIARTPEAAGSLATAHL
jgi:leucine dehydrogenase